MYFLSACVYTHTHTHVYTHNLGAFQILPAEHLQELTERPGSEVYIEVKQDMQVFLHVVSVFAMPEKIGKQNHFKFVGRV